MSSFDEISSHDIIVLYIQLNEDFGDSIYRAVKPHVKRLLRVKNAQEALFLMEYDRKETIDIVLTDVYTEGFDTFDLLKKIRSFRPKTLAIIMTPLAHNQIFDYISYIDAKNDYIAEPFDEKQFLRTLAENVKKIENLRQEEKATIQLRQYKKALNDIAQVMILNPRGVVKEVNNNFLTVFGFSPSEVVGASLYELFDEELNPNTLKKLFAKLSVQEVWRGSVTCRSNEGKILYGQLTAMPLLDKDGETVEYLLVRTDSTQLVKKSMEAKRSELAKDTFLANMSHEMRTPLNGIIGYAQLMQKLQLPIQAEKYLETISYSGMQLLELINDILDFSKIQSAQLSMNPTVINLKCELEQIAKMFEAQAEHEKVEYRFLIDPKIPENVYCDGMRIKQILLNLLSNAFKFTTSKITVQAFLKKEENGLAYLYFSIMDDGVGISYEEQEYIFDSFVQAKHNTKGNYGGTGLGLTIVRELVRKMDSDITLESAPMQGSTFAFPLVLPISKEKEKIIAVNMDEMLLYEDVHVLIAEDNIINKELIENILKQYNIKTSHAINGKEAIRIYAMHDFDMVFMDINMPIKNGMEATKRILDLEKESGKKHVPIIALTANIMKEDKKRYLEAGMDNIIGKPFKLLELETLLKKYLPKGKEKRQKRSEKTSDINDVFDKIVEDTGISHEKAKLFLEKFITTLEADLPKMRLFGEKKELEKLAALAHKLKGTAGLLCQDDLKEIFFRIEKASKELKCHECLRDIKSAMSKLALLKSSM